MRYKTVKSLDDITNLVATLDTGDIIVTSTDKCTSFNGFVIQTFCHDMWTHSGMVVTFPETGIKYLWESVNQSGTKVKQIDPITLTSGTSSGVRLISLESFLKDGFTFLKRQQNARGSKLGVLYLNRSNTAVSDFTAKILQFAQTPSLHNTPYPPTYQPLIESWWDGWPSLFTLCGCYTTFEVEEMNLQGHHSQQHDEKSHATLFCSQLVVATLAHTGWFSTKIPCYEWTVSDISLPANLNKNLRAPLSYNSSVTVYIFSA